MPRGEGGRGERAAEPLRLVRPLTDLARGHGLVLDAKPSFCCPVSVQEMAEQAIGELRPHRPLAEPDPDVDLLGPEVLRPHVLVDLLQVLPPAGAAV